MNPCTLSNGAPEIYCVYIFYWYTSYRVDGHLRLRDSNFVIRLANLKSKQTIIFQKMMIFNQN